MWFISKIWKGFMIIFYTTLWTVPLSWATQWGDLYFPPSVNIWKDLPEATAELSWAEKKNTPMLSATPVNRPCSGLLKRDMKQQRNAKGWSYSCTLGDAHFETCQRKCVCVCGGGLICLPSVNINARIKMSPCFRCCMTDFVLSAWKNNVLFLLICSKTI